MKKLFMGFLLSVLCLAGVNAQSVDVYNFASSSGTYTALTDGTALTTIPSDGNDVSGYIVNATEANAGTDDENDETMVTLAGIPLGFDFEFAGKTCDKFVVSADGYMLLGEKGTEQISFPNKIYLRDRMSNISAGIGISTGMAVHNIAVSYKTEGEANVQIFTIQFAGTYKHAAITSAENREETPFQYQIKLYQADNHIEFVFDDIQAMDVDDFGGVFYIGLKDAKAKKYVELSWGEWSVSGGWYVRSTEAIETGTTLTFTIPDPCTVPTYTVKDITLTPKSDEMAMVVEVDTTGKSGDGYLVVVSTQPIEGQPAEGMTFSVGEDVLGGKVLAVGKMSSWDPTRRDPEMGRDSMTFTHPASKRDDRLQPNTTYYYAVYFVNTEGCVPRYSQGYFKEGKTATTAPAELKLTESSLNQVKFSAKANDLNEQIAILMTTGKGEDRFSNAGAANRGNFAEIQSDAKVGDKFTVSYKYMGNEIIDTSEVLYVGAAGTAIACAVALENNRVYYFGAVSKGKDNGAYSTLVADAEPYLTPAALPFTDNFSKNFASSPEYEDENGNLITEKVFIGGWAGTTKFELSSSSKAVDGVVSTLKEEPGEAVLMIPALDFPTDSNVLVNIGMNTVYWKGYQTSSFYVADWKEGDSICLEISKDGGKTFEFVKVIHKETDSKNLNNIVLKDYVGVKQAILRLRVKAAAGDKLLNAKVSKISITALPFCPAPKNLRVSTVYGGTLGLTWQAGENGEKQWNISTAAAVAEGQEPAWSRPVLVEQQPYYLAGLADQELYNVRVQAVCEGGRTSGWIGGQVQAGRVPSFTEDFNTEEEPDNWQFGCAYKSPDWYTSWYSNYAKYYQYMTKEAATEGNGALAYDMQHYYKGYYSSYNYLIQTPMVELNPAEKPQLTFDAAFGSWVNDEFVAMSAENQKDTMHLAMWVCDSGRFNIESAPAKEWRIAELATWSAGKTLTVDLSEFVTEAKVVSVAMVVYTEPVAASETHMLYLDNIGIVNTAPLARSVKVAKLGAEEATIQWVADKNVEKWLVKLEGGSLTAPRFFEDVAGNTQVFEGLEAEKTYTASVTPAGNGQAAAAERWVSVQFTTLAASCPEPTALAVTSVAQRTAVLTWQGEAADGYYVRYRPVAAQGAEAMPWIEARVKEGTSYTLSGLTPGTKYECEVQGVCSEVAEFYSEWVALEGGFTTRAITCFAPTELRCPESTIGTKTAKVSWTGTSAGYQVAWAVSNSDNWTYGEVVSEAAYTIKGLNYSSWYTFKVRGVCAADDSSEWSETRNFRTLARPACANPTNLRVESLTQTSADLKWDYAEAEEGDLASFTLRHREASVQAWDSIREVEGTTYAIKDMKPQTAYIWNVMAICQDDRNSEWLNLRFTTLAADTVPGNDTTAVEDLKLATGLYVAASQGQIHVMNPKSVRIDNIRIYGLSGQRLEQYAIRSTDHVILTTAVRQRVAIVEVESEGRFIRFKVMLP